MLDAHSEEGMAPAMYNWLGHDTHLRATGKGVTCGFGVVA
eukprot:CAMPEP_0179052242 /NCGR_PEP_ID=MMETSP0796-20121207/21658_1 /TAXON_ID=73915 /ORGANISM="Pyrodinium bahamense, Strain pbaha01" /LENGTH=39 /DNA_ID= /DNA_START= /DNA_END= /DNA_ORIENTATION=